MRAILAILIVIAAIGTCVPPASAGDAVELSREVIEQQFEAFRKDDVDAAYSLAAPAIRARYPDKNMFLAMVKASYEPIYRPANYAYGRSLTLGDGAIVAHEVMIEGRDGRYWRAFFRLTRQPDGAYRIEGVLMLPDRVNKGV